MDASWVTQERRRPIAGFIGGYLIADGVVTLEELDRALERQLRLAAQGRDLRLGEVLVEMSLVTNAQLKRALARQAADQEQRLAPAKTRAVKPRGTRRTGRVKVKRKKRTR